MTESTKPVGDSFALSPDPIATEEMLPSPSEPVDVVAPAAAKQPSAAWIMARELIETVVLSLIIFLVIRQLVQNYRIENHSMEPNFYEGQFVLVNKLAYKLGQPDRGDVVVFHNPRNTNEDYIKRIVGVPGDQVEIREGYAYVNGQLLPEDYPHNPIPLGEVMGPVIVGDKQLFVMGDNRPNSSDSRVFGPVAQDLVVGQAWLRIWPFNTFGIVQHEDLAPKASSP